MADSPSRGPALEAPMPPALTEERDERGLVLTYRWFTPVHVVMLLFCIFWDGFLVFWYRTALERHAGLTDPMIWFPLLHVAVGIGLSYSTVAGFLNRTIVAIGSGEITIRQGPVPWPGNRTVNGADIRQLFREETFTSSRGGRRASYHVCAVTSEKRKLRLLGNVPGADVALYLEQAIEKALGIEDQPVLGEMPK